MVTVLRILVNLYTVFTKDLCRLGAAELMTVVYMLSEAV